MINLFDLLLQTAKRRPRSLSAIQLKSGNSFTYEQLIDAVSRSATHLSKSGIHAGSCVGLHVPSGLNYIILNYAVWKCGACVVPIPVELSKNEKLEICRTIGIDFIVSASGSSRFLESLMLESMGMTTFTLSGGTISTVRLKQPKEHPGGFDQINAAFIRFTSGTTGQSKGVVLSHETILERVEAANRVLELNSTDRVLWLLSMSYHFAVSIVAYLNYGSTIVLPTSNLVDAITRAVAQTNATFVYGTPTHFDLMANYDGIDVHHSIRLAISTTTRLDTSIADRFFHRFDVPITQALGIIEVGLPFINCERAIDQPDAIGPPIPDIEVNFRDVGLGERSKEILLRGKGFLDAYYEPWAPRVQILSNGWFHTGDVGHIDINGCVFLTGRIKDIVDIRGMKFFPQEVERVLCSHPSVIEACVFEKHDAGLGQLVMAQIVVESDFPDLSYDLMRLCRRQLAEFKVPQRIEIVDRLTKTGSGKIRRLFHQKVSQKTCSNTTSS